jgi:D-xylose 1-dehydrogenase (NADP+, D-xylono-1,5-lactone-forming)
MTRPLRLGILSTARIAERVVRGARGADGVELAAVGSRDRARADAYAAEHGIPRAHGSYEALLADPEVDAVYIPLPNALHVPWSIRALEAGKHVLCEKPLSRRPEDVDAAFDAAQRAGRLLMEAFMWRFHPATDQLTRLVAEGTVGNLRVVRACFGFDIVGRDENVRWSGELEGGALMDVGCYCVSALRLLCGEPERVSGEAVAGGAGVDARFAGVLRFAGDVLGVFDCGMDVTPLYGIEVVGDRGLLRSSDPWHGVSPALALEPAGGAPEPVTTVAVDPYCIELERFARAVRDGAQAPLGRDDALCQARTIAALYRSADEGRAVSP